MTICHGQKNGWDISGEAYILVAPNGDEVEPPIRNTMYIKGVVNGYNQCVHKHLKVPDAKLPGVGANRPTRTRGRKPVKPDPDAVSSAAVIKPNRRRGRKKTTTKTPKQKSTQSNVQPNVVKSEDGVLTDDGGIEAILSSNTTHSTNNTTGGGDAVVQSVVTQPTNVTSGNDINCYDLPTDNEGDGEAETITSSSSTTRPTNLNIANNVGISKRPLSGTSKEQQVQPPKSYKSNNKNLASSHPALLNSNSSDADGGNLHSRIINRG